MGSRSTCNFCVVDFFMKLYTTGLLFEGTIGFFNINLDG